MEIVSIRFQEDVLKSMDNCIRQNNFNSRTEFIRVAVRDKISELSRQELIEEFLKLRGSMKPRTSQKVREEIGRQLLREHGIKV